MAIATPSQFASAETPAALDQTSLASAVSKNTWRLLPFLALGFFFNFLDRTSVSFAALQMNKDLGLTATQFGWGAGLLFISYCIFEVPSNMAMHRFGARRWLARIMITWGIAAAATAFATGPLSFYILRFALGAFEAGFFPGVILYLSLWFPTQYRARIVALFIAAAPISQFIGAPVSIGLMQMDGIGGLAGWQWLFIIEGLPTCLLGLACLRLLTDNPKDATWLSEGEKSALSLALASETHERPTTRLRDAVADIRVLILAGISLAFTAGSFGVSFWLPLIMKDAGFSQGSISWMSAIPYLIATIISLLWAGYVDRTGHKIFSLLVSLILGIVGLALSVMFASFIPALICLTISLVGTIAARSLFFTIPQSYLAGAATAGGLAFINCIGSLGGFVGPYLVGWLKDTTGSYNNGMLGMAGIVGIAAVLTIALKSMSTSK